MTGLYYLCCGLTALNFGLFGFVLNAFLKSGSTLDFIGAIFCFCMAFVTLFNTINIGYNLRQIELIEREMERFK